MLFWNEQKCVDGDHMITLWNLWGNIKFLVIVVLSDYDIFVTYFFQAAAYS